jgi:hypothetical protein
LPRHTRTDAQRETEQSTLNRLRAVTARTNAKLVAAREETAATEDPKALFEAEGLRDGRDFWTGAPAPVITVPAPALFPSPLAGLNHRREQILKQIARHEKNLRPAGTDRALETAGLRSSSFGVASRRTGKSRTSRRTVSAAACHSTRTPSTPSMPSHRESTRRFSSASPKGGYLDLHNWRNRDWYPALEAAGLERRGPNALRHSFASFAIRNGIDAFRLARLMGTSVQMIDQHYGHLLRGAEEDALHFLSRESSPKVDPAEEAR